MSEYDIDLIHVLGGLPLDSDLRRYMSRDENKPRPLAFAGFNNTRTDTIILPAGTRPGNASDTSACLGDTLKIANMLSRKAEESAGDFAKVVRIVVDGRILVEGEYEPGRWRPDWNSCRSRRMDILEIASMFADRIDAVLHVEADEEFDLWDRSTSFYSPNTLFWRGKSLRNLPRWRSEERMPAFKRHIYDIDMTADCRSSFCTVEDVLISIAGFAEDQSALMSSISSTLSHPIILRLHVDVADEAAKKTFEEVQSRMPESRTIGSVLLQFGGDAMVPELPYEIARAVTSEVPAEGASESAQSADPLQSSRTESLKRRIRHLFRSD